VRHTEGTIDSELLSARKKFLQEQQVLVEGYFEVADGGTIF
jgi:hypothetical protein